MAESVAFNVHVGGVWSDAVAVRLPPSHIEVTIGLLVLVDIPDHWSNVNPPAGVAVAVRLSPALTDNVLLLELVVDVTPVVLFCEAIFIVGTVLVAVAVIV